MNEWQALQQIRHRLRTATWPSSATLVWGTNVHVTAGAHGDAVAAFRCPLVLLRPGSGDHDPEAREEFGLVERRVIVRLIQSLSGDPVGENALLGGNRQSVTSSQGRGLLELEERLMAVCKTMTQSDGVFIQVHASSEVDAGRDESLGYVVFRDYELTLKTTVEAFYPPPRAFLATGGGGTVTMSWKLPPSRFDRLRVLLRRLTGATAPADITQGVNIALGSDLPSSFVDTGITPGTYSYSLFAAYDDWNAMPSVERWYSSPVSRAGIVVS